MAPDEVPVGPIDPDQAQRVKLPSGKRIDVVVFGAHSTPVAPAGTPRTQLHLCRGCASELVHPVEWEDVGDDRWKLVLRCPNCGWAGEGVYERRTVEDLDEQLERGTEAIVGDLRRLTHANMEEQIERFIRALDDDLIVPFDF